MPIEGLTYKDEVVRLSDIFTVQAEISGLQFERCLVVGPAVVLFMDQTTLVRNTFAASPGSLTIEITPGRPLVGVLGLRNASFVDCRFENIGIVGDAAFLKSFEEGVEAS